MYIRKSEEKAGGRGTGDDVQGNFWKLLNNSNFGFDCKDNSQNRSLHLLYDEEAELELLSKYNGKKKNNIFLSTEAKIREIDNKYSNIDNLAKDEKPFAESIKKAEIEKVLEEHGEKRVKKAKEK